MKLFEATNGWIGESYVRRYVWTTDATRAEALVRELGGNWDTPELRIVEVFDQDASEFVSEESDSGLQLEPAPRYGGGSAT